MNKTFLNETEIICSHTLKWLEVLLCNSISFICTQLNGAKYCYVALTIQFNISNFAHSSIWSINRTLLGTTTPGQSGSGSNGNEGVLQIPQSFRIGTSSDGLVSYPGHTLAEGFYLSEEMESVYSKIPADWVEIFLILDFGIEIYC